MKLVELLAHELNEWPEKASHAVQHENGDVGFTYDGKPGRDEDHSDWSINALTASRKAYWLIGAAASISTTASDHATAIVTRTDWSSERARIAKPAKKADKDGWIRHRGGKCPVDAGVKVDYRMRNGSIDDFGRKSETLDWAHYSEIGDIMAYKLHKPAEQVDSSPRKCEGRSCSMPDSGEHSKDCLLDAALDQGWAGPCEWRDRITTIDFDIHSLTTERAELVQKLASEGFALIGRVVEPVKDMGDWRNWKTGDLIEMVNQKHWADMTDGNTYALTKAGGKGFSFVDDIGDMRDAFERVANDYAKDFKWHSRPSA